MSDMAVSQDDFDQLYDRVSSFEHKLKELKQVTTEHLDEVIEILEKCREAIPELKEELRLEFTSELSLLKERLERLEMKAL